MDGRKPQTVSRPLTAPTKKKRTKAFIWAFILLIALLTIVAWYLHGNNHGNDRTSSSRNTKINSIPINYITIPTGVNESQDYPMDGASVAQEHYFYIDTSGPLHNLNEETGGKLVYDGRPIYSSVDLATNNFAISQNGLHYEYMRYDNQDANIYVDNNLVKTIPDQPTSYSVALYGVSNNGKNYAYSYSSAGQGFELFTNNTSDYNSSGIIENVDFSSDFSDYVAVVQVTSGSNISNEVILDGKILGTGIQASISSNGLHYTYLAGSNSNGTDSVIVDSNKVGSVTLKVGDGDDVIVNNNGSYAYTDYVNSRVNINGKIRSIPRDIPYGCGTSCVNLFAVNQYATDYIVGDENPGGTKIASPIWDLNGSNVNLSGDIEALEFSNNSNSLYVYRWSN
ncbi:MAG TPA: hypothetical protein VMR18_02400 [Candidatus Saccharimonadales bacterium]|nr:hypothetical protein [Candidatus Saccharimonadales bacterium]